MNVNYYNINGLVKFALIGSKRFTKSFRYYDYIVDSLNEDELDFTINLNKFDPNFEKCYILDDDYYIKKNYLYCKKDRYKALKWEIEFNDLETNHIKVNLNIKSFLKLKVFYIMLEGYIIDPMIHYCLSKNLYVSFTLHVWILIIQVFYLWEEGVLEKLLFLLI